MNRRKIAVITGSRADYGLLRGIIQGIRDDRDLILQLVVTGMHLSAESGRTVREIEKDGFPIAARVDMKLVSDTSFAVASSMGTGMKGFASAYARLRPDMIVVLGDRFEIHAAVSAAVPFRIPVAHIHGGESTEGVFDEQFRHSITKISHVHFPSTHFYKQRIVQMGEDPKYVFCFGAPGIDAILRLKKLLDDRETLCRKLKIPAGRKIGAITYHPITLEADKGVSMLTELFQALVQTKGIYWVVNSSSGDIGGRMITERIKSFVKRNPGRAVFYKNLGQKTYFSLLKHASVMVGNSSSGIIESPSFHLPAVNVGDRQRGRVRAANVIDIRKCQKSAIAKAIQKAVSPKFKASLKRLKNPYGNGDASRKIVAKLKEIPLNEQLLKKVFHEFKNRNY
ncbi:MAG: UDP-N-acetylglucosamine 2-epimerase [Candidatus Omnitrophota bacterium]